MQIKEEKKNAKNYMEFYTSQLNNRENRKLEAKRQFNCSRFLLKRRKLMKKKDI